MGAERTYYGWKCSFYGNLDKLHSIYDRRFWRIPFYFQLKIKPIKNIKS